MKFVEEQIEKTICFLSRLNWITIAIMIAFLLCTSILQKYLGVEILPELSAKLYIGAIAIGIIAIPLSSWYYSKSLKRISTTESIECNLRIYRVAFGYKLIIISAAFLFNLILFYFSRNTHLLIIGAIYIVYQMVAIQSKDSVYDSLGVEQPRDSKEVAQDL